MRSNRAIRPKIHANIRSSFEQIVPTRTAVACPLAAGAHFSPMPDIPSLHAETHLKVLRLLQSNPKMNQRDLAAALGVSLGKTNFCLQALVAKGLLKMQNFQSNKRKLAYVYLLTPAGLLEKAALTSRFLKRKMDEYEALRVEIEGLRQEEAAASR